MKKSFKTVITLITIIIIITFIWVGTVMLQKPPKYPTAKIDINKYYNEYRMNYSVAKEGLIKDIDALVDYTEELHADPYRVTEKVIFLEKAEAIKSKIRALKSDKISIFDSFYFLQELAVFLEDGHTTLYPLNWEKTVGTIFPLSLTSIGDRIFVQDSYGANYVPKRAEILVVNGINIKQIIEDGLKYMPGTLHHLKQARIAEQFSLLLQTYYKMPSPWQITYKHNGTINTTTIEGITYQSFVKASALINEYHESEIKVSGQSVPVLELNFAGFGDVEWDDFKVFIDNFFAKNKDKPYLIIDARHHHGG